MKNTDPMNQYLDELKRQLFALGQTQREKIAIDLKENMQSVLSQHPNLTIQDLLGSLGSAKHLSHFFLVSQGLAPEKMKSTRSALKIFSLVLLCCLALLILGISLLIHRFTPFINLDSQQGKISFLGDSLVFTSPTNGTTPSTPSTTSNSSTQFNGEQIIDVKSVDSVIIHFDSGHFDVSQSDVSKITWQCDLTSISNSDLGTDSSADSKIPSIKNEIKSFHMDFSELNTTSCHLKIPKGLHFSLTGNNGSVILRKIHFHAYVEMKNGEVEWENDPNAFYQFMLHITNGQIDQFESSDKTDALKIEIKLENGSIIHK